MNLVLNALCVYIAMETLTETRRHNSLLESRMNGLNVASKFNQQENV